MPNLSHVININGNYSLQKWEKWAKRQEIEKKKKSKSNIPDNFDGTILLLLLLVQTYYHYRIRTFQNLTANILFISPTMTSIFKTLTALITSIRHFFLDRCMILIYLKHAFKCMYQNRNLFSKRFNFFSSERISSKFMNSFDLMGCYFHFDSTKDEQLFCTPSTTSTRGRKEQYVCTQSSQLL